MVCMKCIIPPADILAADPLLAKEVAYDLGRAAPPPPPFLGQTPRQPPTSASRR